MKKEGVLLAVVSNFDTRLRQVGLVAVCLCVSCRVRLCVCCIQVCSCDVNINLENSAFFFCKRIDTVSALLIADPGWLGRRAPLRRDHHLSRCAWSVFACCMLEPCFLLQLKEHFSGVNKWWPLLFCLFNAYILHLDTTLPHTEVGVEKPNRCIFEAALEALHVQPEEAVHVGDDRCVALSA